MMNAAKNRFNLMKTFNRNAVQRWSSGRRLRPTPVGNKNLKQYAKNTMARLNTLKKKIQNDKKRSNIPSHSAFPLRRRNFPNFNTFMKTMGA